MSLPSKPTRYLPTRRGTKPSERKAPTSVENLKYTKTDLDETRRFLDVLAERNRLLVVLFQFPVSFNSPPKIGG